MNLILKYGHCVVGNFDAMQTCSDSTLVEVMISVQHSHLPSRSKTYLLDELKDLESKVVLATGNEPQQVARFVDVRKYEAAFLLSYTKCLLYLHFSFRCYIILVRLQKHYYYCKNLGIHIIRCGSLVLTVPLTKPMTFKVC